ncbi:hypothetical protein M434DRAFT_256925 [Hypoxylon sp. CO27-5]|nr:hypothetical protein M434DRAFT_256925 [Hypoxylon sp. CO27-5]
MTPERIRRYQNECEPLRDAFVAHMDRRDSTYGTIGRWARTEQPSGRLGGQSISEEEEMRDAKWTKGWYCIKHRPYHTCLNCGHFYGCAVCANPYTCTNCKTAWTCTACGDRSYVTSRVPYFPFLTWLKSQSFLIELIGKLSPLNRIINPFPLE